MKNSEVEDFWNGLKLLGQVVGHVAEGIQDIVEDNKEELEALKHYFENFEDVHSQIWRKSAEYGWFPNDFITTDFEIYTDQGQESLDNYMSKEIEEVIEHIHKQLVSLYPNRQQIIDIAFELHAQEKYIAAIPLFFSQTDGICSESIGSYLFSGNEDRLNKIKERIADDPKKAIILAPLLQNTQFGARISNSKSTHKVKAPNRNGILHGSRRHLNYGTKLNSLKCISLLSYVSTIFMNKK